MQQIECKKKLNQFFHNAVKEETIGCFEETIGCFSAASRQIEIFQILTERNSKTDVNTQEKKNLNMKW